MMLPLGLLSFAAAVTEERETAELALPVLFWRLDSEEVRRSA